MDGDWNIAYALTEEGIGLVQSHYQGKTISNVKEMSNFLIANKAEIKEHKDVPAGALMVELIRIADRIASQDRPTVVVWRRVQRHFKTGALLRGGFEQRFVVAGEQAVGVSF